MLALRGEAGIGKTALLDYVGMRASGCRIVRAVGVESEMELAFAGLHQLCAPMLGDLERLPAPQRDALRVVFGLQESGAPDRFLVALAALSLLAEFAEESPLVCLIEDAQWLDHASVQALTFVARRLLAERIAMVFAVRESVDTGALGNLPQLIIGPLSDADARRLLSSSVPGLVDERVRERIIAEAGGNPLALIELPRGLTSAVLASGFGPATVPLASRVEEGFMRRLEPLPLKTRKLLLVAALEPVGDVTLFWRAAERLGIEVDAAAGAEAAGLVTLGTHVRFRHPLVRSAVCRAADLRDLRETHQALADVTDPKIDPDRRAWHRARAAAGPDEAVAGELERSAGRAQARGGVAAAAACLSQATTLTPDPARRAQRALDAAQASFRAGAFETALELLVAAESGPLDEYQRARLDWVRAQVAFASGLGGDAPPLLLRAARKLEPFDLELARETYLTAWCAAGIAGNVAGRDVFLEICRAARALPRSAAAPRPIELLLDGLALLVTDGHAGAATTLQRAGKALTDITVEEVLRWGWLAPSGCADIWDIESLQAIATRQVHLTRKAGALGNLPFHLYYLGMARQWTGDFADAEALIAETQSAAAAIGSPYAPYNLMTLRALQGREAETSAAAARAFEAAAQGQGFASAYAHWALAILYNGLSRYAEAASAAKQAASDTEYLLPIVWALPELVEAAARAGDSEGAHAALVRLSEMTRPCGADFPLGVEMRCRALLSDGTVADELYREAIERLSRTPVRPEIARAHLLYGEWLRRERRRVDAREQLRMAHETFLAIGMEAFAERARIELQATGESVRKRTAETRDDLTAQERQVARLAADGNTNPEIGAQLFISPRTVEYHLHKVFAKLGVSSRRELRRMLPDAEHVAVPA